MPAILTEGQKKLFRRANFGHLATLMSDGSPQVTTVWVDLDDGRILVNTAEGRTKIRNIRHDARVAIEVTDQQNPYAAVFVRGRVVRITTEGAVEHINKLSEKYLHQEKFDLTPGEQRVILEIEPEHVASRMVG